MDRDPQCFRWQRLAGKSGLVRPAILVYVAVASGDDCGQLIKKRTADKSTSFKSEARTRILGAEGNFLDGGTPLKEAAFHDSMGLTTE